MMIFWIQLALIVAPTMWAIGKFVSIDFETTKYRQDRAIAKRLFLAGEQWCKFEQWFYGLSGGNQERINRAVLDDRISIEVDNAGGKLIEIDSDREIAAAGLEGP